MKTKLLNYLGKDLGLFFLVIILTFVFTKIYLKGYWVYGDSLSYIDWSPQRPFLYPIYLNFLELFGSNYLNVSFSISILLNLVAILFFYLQFKLLAKQSLLSFFASVSLLIPIKMDMANYQFAILSEQLTYPLFIFYLALMLNVLRTKSTGKVFLLLFLFFVLISLRLQLIYLVFPIIILLKYLGFGYLKSLGIPIILLIASIVIDNISRINNFGVISGSKSFYMTFATASLFLSNDDDVRDFKKEIKNEFGDYASEIHNQVNLLKANKSFNASKNKIGIYNNYIKNYDVIQWNVLGKYFIKKNNDSNEWGVRDDFSKEYAFFFIKNNIFEYLSLIFINIYGFYLFDYQFLILLTFLFFVNSVKNFINQRYNSLDFSIFLLVFIYLFNTVIVASTIYMDARCLFYGDLSVYSSVVLGICRINFRENV